LSIYVTNDNVFVAPSTVAAYRIFANGALAPVAGSPFQTGAPLDYDPVSVAVDPLGRFAYVANLPDNTISAYRIGLNGALTPVAGSPFQTGKAPYSIAIDP
jgi:6-phosphogluconolactonase